MFTEPDAPWRTPLGPGRSGTRNRRPHRPQEHCRARDRHRLPHPRPGARRLDRPRPPRRRHHPRARRRRRPEGRQRPSRHRDEPGPAGLHAVPAGHAARPERPRLDRPRPVRAVLRALQPHPLHPAVPVRLRAGARRPAGAAHLGIEDPRAPRAPAHPRRRDHHRPAGPGPGLRGRDGDGRQPRARPVRPGRRARPEPVRPPDLRHRLRRRHRGGRHLRGVARWPATSSWATSRWSTTTTRSPSRTTPPSRCPRTPRSATRPTAGTCRSSRAGRTSPASWRRWRRRRRRPRGRRSSCCARSSASRRRTR